MRHQRQTRQGRVNLPLLIGGMGVVLPMLLLLYVSFGRNPRAVPMVLGGEPAPEFSLVDLDGNIVALEDVRGKKIIVNFWATDCVPCKIEHPLLVAGPRAWPDAVFLGILYGDEPDNARRYLSRAGSSYAHLIDPGGRGAIDYGVAGVPETYLIDESGSIVHKVIGVIQEHQLVDFLGTP